MLSIHPRSRSVKRPSFVWMLVGIVTGLAVMSGWQPVVYAQSGKSSTAKPRPSSPRIRPQKTAAFPLPDPAAVEDGSRVDSVTGMTASQAQPLSEDDDNAEDSADPPVVVSAAFESPSMVSESRSQGQVASSLVARQAEAAALGTSIEGTGLVVENPSSVAWEEEGMGNGEGGCDAHCDSQALSFGHVLPIYGEGCSPWLHWNRRWYVRGEFAWFWGSGQSLPTLVTTSVGNPLPPIEEAGLLDDPDTRSLFGGSEVGVDATVGWRSEVGIWLEDNQASGFLLRAFDAGENDLGFQSNQSIHAVIARNFLDVGPPLEQSLVSIAYPAQTFGSVDANLSSNTYGGDLLFRSLICQDDLGRWDWIGGYQLARLDESLQVVSRTNSLTPPNPILDQADHFATSSRFHGGTLGVLGEVRDGCWYFGSLIKLGLGNMERETVIRGSSTTTINSNRDTRDEGLLARRTNNGTYTDDTFVWVPELGLTAGYRLTRCLDVTLSYGFLRLPKVTRVTAALDPELASNLSDPLTGEVRPRFQFSEANFSLHSLNVGLQLAY
jgi:hypothetical protein